MPMRTIDIEDLIADVHRVAAKLGHSPSRTEYDLHGRYTSMTAVKRSGRSWVRFLALAGLEPAPKTPRGRIAGAAQDDPDDRPRPQPQQRRCLKCDRMFPSEGAHHRVCDPCKWTEDWRHPEPVYY